MEHNAIWIVDLKLNISYIDEVILHPSPASCIVHKLKRNARSCHLITNQGSFFHSISVVHEILSSILLATSKNHKILFSFLQNLSDFYMIKCFYE